MNRMEIDIFDKVIKYQLVPQVKAAETMFIKITAVCYGQNKYDDNATSKHLISFDALHTD